MTARGCDCLIVKKFLTAGTHHTRERFWMMAPGQDAADFEEMVEFTFTVSRIKNKNPGLKI